GAAPLPEGVVEALAAERILAQDDGLQHLDQGDAVEVRAAHRRAQERVPGDALVGGEREEAQLALAAEPAGVAAVGRRRDAGPGEQRERDVGDLHDSPQIARSVPVTSAAASLARKRIARATDSGATQPLRSDFGMARRFASVSIV